MLVSIYIAPFRGDFGMRSRVGAERQRGLTFGHAFAFGSSAATAIPPSVAVAAVRNFRVSRNDAVERSRRRKEAGGKVNRPRLPRYLGSYAILASWIMSLIK